MSLIKTKTNMFGEVLFSLVLTILAMAGSLYALEIYTIPISILLVSLALLTSASIKPFLFLLVTISYHLPAVHLYPSDYYTTGYHPHILLGSILVLLISLGVYIVKNQLFQRVPLTKIPLFFPLCVMTVGMLLNGAQNPDYKYMNFVWAALMMLVYFFVYVVIYLAIKDEDPRRMVEYFTYLTLFTSWILLSHMAKIYFVDGVMVNGELHRGNIITGYGVCNLIGFHITTMIPVNFYGFMKGRTPMLSFVTAVALWIAGIATTSRNAALVGTVYFVFCLILAAIKGERVKSGRIILATALGIVVATMTLYYLHNHPEIATPEPLKNITDIVGGILEQYSDRGLDSSGRTDIWKVCVGIFKENSIFGAGFFGMRVAQQFVPAEYIPEYAHNTIFELIAATGIVGTLSYGFYRLATIKMMLHRFDLDRFMILLGASVLVAESLLDNYVFQIYTTFYYVIALAIAARLYETSRDEYGLTEFL